MKRHEVQLLDTCQRCREAEHEALDAGRWVPPRRPAVATRNGVRVCTEHDPTN